MGKRHPVLAAVLAALALAAASCANPLVSEFAGGAPGAPEADARATGSVRVRVVASNLSSGNYQDYDLGHGLRILQGLNPDVVLMQEFNYKSNSAAELKAFANLVMEGQGYYSIEGGADIPNGVISRYPILASGEWDDSSVTNRDFAWARIDIPGSVDLYAVSVHLLTSSSTVRNTEAKQLVAYIKSKIPTAAYLVIGGDFNTGTKTEACYSTLAQVVSTASPYPVCTLGDQDTNSTRSKPYDAVLADADLSAYKTPVLIGSRSFASGLVVDTRTYTPLTDLYPAIKTDSGATNMQHMAVVRDFAVPADGVPDPDPEPDPQPSGNLAFLKSDMEAGGPAGLPSGGSISTASYYAGLASFRYQKSVSSSLTVPMTSTTFSAPGSATKLSFWFKGSASGTAPGLRVQVAAGGTVVNYYDLNSIVSGTTLYLNPTAGGTYSTKAISVGQWTKVVLNLSGVNWGGLDITAYKFTFRVRAPSTHDWYIDDIRYE